MSKVNALAGLIGSYGDSDDESDDGGHGKSKATAALRSSLQKPATANTNISKDHLKTESNAAIHPAPITHCPWSACFDENSGFTYYWNQQTNAVTWEAPPEYLLALKLAQQQLHTIGSSEVSAEEWQLYQQALVEKQNAASKIIAKPPVAVPPVTKFSKKTPAAPTWNPKASKRRCSDDDDDVKIELITSYHNSDSDSNEEPESPLKPPPPAAVKPPKIPKTSKKIKKTTLKVVEYGPPLPPNQNYTVPIGPELPPELAAGNVTTLSAQKPNENLVDAVSHSPETKISASENEDSQDERLLLSKLKNKAKLLEKLGGEIPAELQKIIQDETQSKPSSPKVTDENSKETQSTIDTNIDDLLEEIEKKELPKVKSRNKSELSNDVNANDSSSPKHSPKPCGMDSAAQSSATVPLFPSTVNMTEEPVSNESLFPSASNINEIVSNDTEEEKKESSAAVEKKSINIYLMDTNEMIENVSRKKLRISNSVLPVKKNETPTYTTKYSQSIEGFSGERTGLGFSKDDDEESPKNTVSYGNGLTFTKGETLNEEKKDEGLEDLTDLLQAKLKYLNQLQPSPVTPMQEMVIQMQTLSDAFAVGALTGAYWRRWAGAAAAALARHEAAAAPPGWRCCFLRSEGRYRYERESDGLVQWEYPADSNMDMDISTTPPHPGIESKEATPPPPLPPLPPPPPPPPPVAPRTPPPPAWADADPPPPGCDDPPPPPPPAPAPPLPAPAPPTPAPPLPAPAPAKESAQQIGDELMSFYNDIAKLEKTSAGSTAPNSPDPPLTPEIIHRDIIREREDRDRTRVKEHSHRDKRRDREHSRERITERDHSEKERTRDKDRERDKDGKSKRKSKVKISSSIGMKHKSVSNLVAKWQQVAEEIHSD